MKKEENHLLPRHLTIFGPFHGLRGAGLAPHRLLRHHHCLGVEEKVEGRLEARRCHHRLVDVFDFDEVVEDLSEDVVDDPLEAVVRVPRFPHRHGKRTRV